MCVLCLGNVRVLIFTLQFCLFDSYWTLIHRFDAILFHSSDLFMFICGKVRKSQSCLSFWDKLAFTLHPFLFFSLQGLHFTLS